MKPLPKLISQVRAKCPEAIICGFKLLVNSTKEELLEASLKSLINNKLNLVVGNDLRDIKKGQHKLLIVEKKGNNVVSNMYEEDLHKVVLNKCLEHFWNIGEVKK